MFIIQLTALDKHGIDNFYWQLFNLILYVPWNVLPISYILWCHAQTYNHVLKEAKRLKMHKSNETNKQNLDEVVCNMLMADVDGTEPTEPRNSNLVLESYPWFKQGAEQE